MTRVRSLAQAGDLSSSLCVQTSSESHPASYPHGTRGPFLAVKRSRGVTSTTHSHPVLRSRMRSYSSSPPWDMHGGSGTTFMLHVRSLYNKALTEKLWLGMDNTLRWLSKGVCVAMTDSLWKHNVGHCPLSEVYLI
jgi:hypothetical protein